MRYYAQRLSSSNTWLDILGSNNYKDCKSYAQHVANTDRVVSRVIIRTDAQMTLFNPLEEQYVQLPED